MRKTILALTAAVALVAGAAQAQTATYAIDPAHTFVTFEIRHFGTSTNRGRFDKKTGTVQLDKAGKSGKVDLTIETASINTGFAPFEKHLRSADFFDVEKFPTAKFEADKFSFDGDKVSAVEGTLTMLGKTQPITLKAQNFNCYENPMLKREVCGGDFDAVVDRSLYGMTWGMQYGFSKDVHLVIQVEAVKQ